MEKGVIKDIGVIFQWKFLFSWNKNKSGEGSFSHFWGEATKSENKCLEVRTVHCS